MGKGVLQAVGNINGVISKYLIGREVTDQSGIDKLMVEELDGSKNEFGFTKSKLGANSILPVSIALARAGAASVGLHLHQYISHLAGRGGDGYVMPVPLMNLINGGQHASNQQPF